VQRVICLDCNKSFVAGKAQHKREVVRRHLEDHSSYRTIERRNGFTKMTANKIVHEMAAQVKDSHWVAKNLKPQWKGVLVFDGTYLNVRNEFADIERELGWCEDERFLHKLIALLGIDFHTRDLPHYSIGDNENMIDLVLYFQQLKENGYPLKALVRDGNERIEEAAKKVFGSPLNVQLCHHHFLDKFDKKIAEKGCSEFEKQHIMDLRMRVCLIIRVPTIDIACQRITEFIREKNQFKISKATTELVEKFIKNFEYLTEYLQHPRGWIPTTVNVCENMNKQLKDRTDPMCMFQSIGSVEDYLKLWCLKRRFQKFTDCRKPFKNLNGKAPLELAKCRISHLDYLNL
jgi:hypothetical protein